MFKLMLRNVFRQKARSRMTLAAIVVGVVGLILAAGFVHDTFSQLGEAMIRSQSGHIQIIRPGYLAAGARSPEKFVIDTPQPVRDQVLAMPEVDDVLGRISFTGLLSGGKADLAVVCDGVEPDREGKLGTFLNIKTGRQLVDSDAYGMVIGNGVAKALKLKPGDRATLLVSTASGALNTVDLEVVGVFQTYSKEFDTRAVRIPLAAAQSLIETQGVNSLVVSLKQTKDTTSFTAHLRKSLDPAQLEVKAWYELSDFYEKTVDLYQRQFGVLRLIILVMVLLSVANSVNMNVMERAGEFGTMMALGNRSRMTSELIIAESALLGFAGSLIGVALGIALAWVISSVGISMPPPPNSDLGYTARIQIVPAEIALAFAVGLIATAAASLLPALRIARTPVVEALRRNG